MPGVLICMIILHVQQVFEDASLGLQISQGSEYDTVVYARVTKSSEYV